MNELARATAHAAKRLPPGSWARVARSRASTRASTGPATGDRTRPCRARWVAAVASRQHAIGTAAVQLERTLGEVGRSPFAAAMTAGTGAVEALASDVLRNHKVPLA